MPASKIKSGPVTGLSATSTKLSLGGIVAGLGTLTEGFLHNAQGGQTTADKVVGASMAVVSIGLKIWHDRGLRLADITANAGAAGGDIETLRSDLAFALDAFTKADPAAKTVVTSLEARVNDLTAHVSDVETKVATEVKAAEPDFDTVVGIVKKALGPNAALLQGIPVGPVPPA